MAANRSHGIKNIWIDTDIIFNKPGEEVDDALALIMAFHNPSIKIMGVSLIYNVDNGYTVTKKLRDFYAIFCIGQKKDTKK